MKVLLINTVYGRGSTGRIVADLGKLLEEQGHSYMVAYGRGDHHDDPHCYRIGNDGDRYLHAGLSRITDRAGFYSKSATRKLLDFIRDYAPDVIHLHNLHGYYLNIEVLFEFLATEYHGRVIWTLHDCWALTGHCVFFTYAACDKWKTECEHCAQKGEYPKSAALDQARRNYVQKKQLFTGVGNLEIVTVSNWLKDIVCESFLRDCKVQCIYNGIDTMRFHPVENSVKAELDIENHPMILMVSDGWDKRKGYDTILEIAKAAPPEWRFVMIGLTEAQIRQLPENIIGFEQIWNQDKLIEYYSAADVFLNPSREETFGLVTAEAIACGTPAVVMDSTACPELIVDDGMGTVVEKEADAAAYIQATQKLLERQKRCVLPEQFTKRAFLNAYSELYSRR